MLLCVDFINSTQATIDFKNQVVSIGDDLIVQPFVHSKLPHNVVRSIHAVQIPPQSETILLARTKKKLLPHRRVPCLLEPLPSRQCLNISLARSVVFIKHKLTFCRVFNPTNATVALNPQTPLATISPLSSDAVIEYKKIHLPLTHHNTPGTDLVKHKIDTADANPIRQRPFKHSPEARKEIDGQISKLLDADIIEESDSPTG